MTRRYLIAALLGMAVLFAADPIYIVHWTSQEKCHECSYRNAVICLNGEPDCGVPDKNVDHYEAALTKEAALAIANEISKEKATGDAAVLWGGNVISSTGQPFSYRPKGALVAIYQAVPLPVKIEHKERDEPQPPVKRLETVITLPKEPAR